MRADLDDALAANALPEILVRREDADLLDTPAPPPMVMPSIRAI